MGSVRTPDWAKRLVNLNEQAPACMGFQNGCVCARCTDRQARARCFHSEGLPNADTRAKQESEEFFRTPWLFRFDSDAGFPRPLKESDA